MTTPTKVKVSGVVILLAGLYLLARHHFVPSELPPEQLSYRAWSIGLAMTILGVLGLLILSRVGNAKALSPRHVLIIVVGLYLASFVAPAIDDGNQQTGFGRPGASPTDSSNYSRHWPKVLSGWEVFLSVPAKLPWSFPFLPAWLANLVLWTGLIKLKKGRLVEARRAGILCTVLAFSTVLVLPSMGHWLTPLEGYYLWLAAMVAYWVGVSRCQANEPEDEATT